MTFGRMTRALTALALCTALVACEAEDDGEGAAGGATGGAGGMSGGPDASGGGSGEPDAASGEPDAMSGDADAMPGDPDAAPGDPDAMVGDPDAMPGEPDATPGEPDAEPGEPDAEPGDPDAEPGDPDAEPDAEPASCPGDGPFGTQVGDVAPDFEVLDCDGNPWRLHDHCGEPLWIFEYAAWCPPCRRFMGGIQALYNEFSDTPLQAAVIISQTENFTTPDGDFCESVRARYGLELTVLYDPDGAFRDTMGVPANDVNFLFDAEGRIDYYGRYAGEAAVRRAIQALVGE